MQAKKKVVRVGKGPCGDVFCAIEVVAKGDKVTLSICGVEGPKKNGDCLGSCGQIVSCAWDIQEYAPGWSWLLEQQFREVWRKWHLNDMRAGCRHQTDMGWGSEKIAVACPHCGYKWGYAWKYEPIPTEVLSFLGSLPETDKAPAWV